MTCKRLLGLCGLDTTKLRLTDKRFIGKPDDELDSTDGDDELESPLDNSDENTNDISTSLEDLKGELDTKAISSNEDSDDVGQGFSNSQPSENISVEKRTCLNEGQESNSDLCIQQKSNTENGLEILQENPKPNKDELNNELAKLTEHVDVTNLQENEKSSSILEDKLNKQITADDVAAAICGNNQDNDDVISKVQSLQV